MTKSLRDSVHVILGATGGIGAALCRELHGQGAKLVLGARDAEKLARLAAEFDVPALVVDATVSTDVAALVQVAIDRHGRVDGIANCVGSLLLKPAHLTTDAEWNATMATNLGSAFATVKSATKAMQDTGGSIVLFSSAAARIGLANHEAIAAAKAGIEGLARSAAATYAARKIRVNCVAPGLVNTPLSARITNNASALAGSVAMHAMQRIGEADEVARAAAFFLDPANSWVTGQVLGIDGGLASLRSRS